MAFPTWYVDSCKKIKYLFPKAHAVAYVMMAFRIAWFKVHEPLAFYSAYFYRRSQKDGFDAESMTRGIDVVRAKIRDIKKNQDATAKEEDLLTTLEACYEFYKRGFEFAEIDLYESDAVKFNITPDGLPPPAVCGHRRPGRNGGVRDIVARVGSGQQVHLRGGVLHELPEGFENAYRADEKPGGPGRPAGDEPVDAVLTASLSSGCEHPHYLQDKPSGM